ncbi:MAG: hypothetical protein QE263_05990 [Vampirovibrionales bacterium]|nr:hypothetical protein [Vampirovibrionales bacterium]
MSDCSKPHLTPSLNLVHLYPEAMNLYGDRGNVLTLYQRAHWRGWTVTITEVSVGDVINPNAADIVFMGGGQDSQQHTIAHDFLTVQASPLKAAIENGAVMLGICGGYQLLGHWFDPLDGERINGLGLLDVTTTGGTQRLIGNVVIDVADKGFIKGAHLKNVLGTTTLVGFENHSGQTTLGPKARPLGTIVKGNGNNGHDGTEGAVQTLGQGLLLGTYLHGSLLPKNPHLADALLAHVLRRQQPNAVLPPLDDNLAWQAHQKALLLTP